MTGAGCYANGIDRGEYRVRSADPILVQRVHRHACPHGAPACLERQHCRGVIEVIFVDPAKNVSALVELPGTPSEPVTRDIDQPASAIARAR
jgi:hypothetical protein